MPGQHCWNKELDIHPLFHAKSWQAFPQPRYEKAPAVFSGGLKEDATGLHSFIAMRRHSRSLMIICLPCQISATCLCYTYVSNFFIAICFLFFLQVYLPTSTLSALAVVLKDCEKTYLMLSSWRSGSPVTSSWFRTSVLIETGKKLKRDSVSMCISSRKFCQEPTLALPKVYQRMLGEVPRVPRPLKSVQASKTVHCLYSALRLVAWNLCRLQRRIIICSSAIYCWRRPLRSQAGEAWNF